MASTVALPGTLSMLQSRPWRLNLLRKDLEGGLDETAQLQQEARMAASVNVPWSELAPKTLLAISTSFIQPNAPDAADRQWLCAVYANATAQPDAARQLAESAAQAKPEYRDQMDIQFGR